MAQLTSFNTDLIAILEGVTTDHFFTMEQFQQDMDYYRAQRIAKALLDSGLIFLVAIRQINPSKSTIFLFVSCGNNAKSR